jgi:lysophospholipase L1-like esterase
VNTHGGNLVSASSSRTAKGEPHKNRLCSRLIALTSITVSSLIGLIIADKIAGLFLSRQVNLIFPANTSVTFETGEYKYTAKINSMGFRDREVTSKVRGRRRIIVIGDSFVFGQGVEIEQSWPKVLEADFRGGGQDVEVFDLGCPGDGPTEYLQVARQAIPALSPDLVIVGVLQGDDIMQECIKIDSQANASRQAKPWSLRRRIGEFVAPSLVSLISGKRHLARVSMPASALRGSYKDEVREIMKTLTPDQRSRLDSIDRKAYQMWMDGDLNPYIVDAAVKKPDYFATTLEPEREEVKQAVNRMATCIREIREQAARVGAQVIVVSEPYSAYVSDDGQAQKFGFSLPESALTSTAQDDVIESACRKAGVKCYAFTDTFRREAKRQTLYYKYDGHFTPEGHRLLADLVARSCFNLAAATK